MAQTPGSAFDWINRGVGLLFLVAAALQYNDPDPLRWILVWGAASAACWLFPRGRPSWALPALVALVATLWMLWLAPQALPHFRPGDLFRTMETKTPAIEQSRELLGLAMIAGWMWGLVRVGRRRENL